MAGFPEAPVPRDPAPLIVDRVTKRFGSFTAVDALSLAIRPGEIFALLGPNGAGKTTLIHCIAGLARPTSGSIRVFGYDTIRDFRATRRLVGLVPQEISFDPFFSPHESLMLTMGLMGIPPDAAWADSLLRAFALERQRDAYARTLSGGMKRRLNVAKALVHRPKLLFLDEPTAGVDVELRKELWQEVEKLRDAGTTVILTTHYLEEAEQLADRIGVIHRGRILLVEERDALMRRYRGGVLRARLDEPVTEAAGQLPPGARRLGSHRVEIPWTHPDDLAGSIAALRARGNLLDLSVEHTRLEDIFVELIAAAEQAKGEQGAT
jgi:ABC-2 type transport system ATP-binding protein